MLDANIIKEVWYITVATRKRDTLLVNAFFNQNFSSSSSFELLLVSGRKQTSKCHEQELIIVIPFYEVTII